MVNAIFLTTVGIVWFLWIDGVCTVENGLVKSTSTGFVRGKKVTLLNGEIVFAFLGIPYADPPTGEYRFKPPRDRSPWNGTLNATKFGPICYQPGTIKVWDVEEDTTGLRKLNLKMLHRYEMDEDCLSLNVYTPKQYGDKFSLPVMVFIHGGSYYMNSGRFYPGEKLASKGVVVVTCNYRLGPLGFLSTEDSAATGNYGLLDQIHVLKWVQKNILNFGGDPKKVTIFGNSAGAASVTFHLFSPLARGLFSAIIAQSGCALAPWALQLRPRYHASKLAKQIGCPSSPTDQMIKCIRTFSPVIITQKSTMADGLLVSYAPVVDGWFGGDYLPDHPERLISSGNFEKVPFMTGVTKDEVSIWFQIDGVKMDMSVMKAIVYKYANELLQKKKVSQLNHDALSHAIMAQYFLKRGFDNLTNKGDTKSLIDFISDVGLKAPCVRLLQSINNKTSAHKFMYEFGYSSSDDIKSGKQKWIGSYHESELQFIFGEPYLNYSNTLKLESDKRVSDILMRLWINFASFGEPTTSANNPLNVTWHPYTTDRQAYLKITENPEMEENYLVENILFWNSFYPIFSDYSMEDNKINSSCPDTRRKWLVWFLTSLVCLLCATCVLLLIFIVRRRPSMVIKHNSETSTAM